MKRLSAILTAAVILLSGCSAAGKDAKNNHVTISVWTYYNGAQLTSFNALVEEFNETVGREKEITVESYSQGSVTDLENNVLEAAQSKVGADKIPNIFAAYVDTAYAIDQLGLVANLSDYFTDEEIDDYVEGYVDEGRFGADNGIKIFPCAKSTELFMLNKTDWKTFADATGAKYSDFSTIEGLTAVSQKYYEWTDSLTPDIPNDGKAFYGRDAMANYIIIGSMQLGHEIFSVNNGVMTLDFDKPTIRKLWDNYYVPYINGYFASSGRFRSDDVKTGNILAFVGSSSGATFFPDKVVLSDDIEEQIEMMVFESPQFEDSNGCAVQQGAGMVVTNTTEQEIRASVEFLKWFTSNEQNIAFSIGSGYMPVRKSANDIEVISGQMPELSRTMRDVLNSAIETVNSYTLYTPKAFEHGSDARKILEYSMSDTASADRAIVKKRLAQGETLEQAVKDFVSDEYFEAWYNKVLMSLKEFEGE